MDTTTTTRNDLHCIDVCNSLLRGEISAVETYGKAIEKFAGEPQIGELTQMRAEHQHSVDALNENVLSMRGVPEIESGAWGTFANGVQAAANLFGEESALFSLKQGEEYGQKQYQDALEDEKVMPECKEMMRSVLLPRVDAHIRTLDRLAEEA